MEKGPTYVAMTISSGVAAGSKLSDKMVDLLARWLKRSPGDIRHTLATKKIRISKVHLNDDLHKVIAALQKNGLNVEVLTPQDDTTSRLQVEPTLGTTGRIFGPQSSLNIQSDWKKGEIIEGLYEVLGSAAGGMGKVYFVFHRLWKMMLAIKTPLQETASNEARVRRFLREAELWVNLGLHPNIATCYYARVIDGLPRLFIEYVDGGTLDDWIEKRLIKDTATLVDLMLQFCHGMLYAEGKGLIHRDIKPANCLITSDGTLKVTDFGLVKRVADSSPSGKTDGTPISKTAIQIADDGLTVFEGGVLGSPWYMAPERFREAPEDIRSDIYSFGVMLYETAVGRMPFSLPRGFSLSTLARSHVKRAPVDPLSIKPDLPRSLVRVIATCLEKKPENRYPSFEDVCTDLESLSREIRPEREPRVRPNLVGLMADSLNNQAVSLLDLGRDREARLLLEDAHSANTEHLEAVYNLHTLRWQNAEISDREVIDHLESLQIEVRETAEFAHLMGLIALQRGDPARAINLLEKARTGSPYFQERWDSLGSNPRSYVKSTGFGPIGEQASFAGHIKHVLSVGFPTDVMRAFSVGEDRSIRLWDVDSGRCLQNFRTFTFVPVTGAFSPNGTLAVTAYGDAFKTLDVWDLDRGQLKIRYQGMDVLGVSFSHDSRHVAAFGGVGRVRVMETGSEVIEAEFTLDSLRLSAIAMLGDERSLALGGENGSLSIWILEPQRQLFRVTAHDGPVRTIQRSPDGTAIVTGGTDETVRIWDATSGREIRRLVGHRGSVTDARFTPDGKYVISASADGSLKVWDCALGRCFRTLVVAGEEITCCEVSADGRRVLSGGSKGSLRLWSLSTGWFATSFLEPAVCRPKTFQELAGQHEAFKRQVQLFDKEYDRGDAERALDAFDSIRTMPGFCWSAEAIGIRNRIHRISKRRGLNSSSFIRSFQGHEDAVVSVAVGPDGTTLVSGSLDCTARIWDVVTGRTLTRLSAAAPIRDVRFLAGLDRVLTWSEDNVLTVWSLSGDRLAQIPDLNFPIGTSPDGMRAVALSLDNKPVWIETDTGRSSSGNVFMPGSGFLCFSENLETLFSLRDGRRILRWSVATGRNEGAFRDLGLALAVIAPVRAADAVAAGAESGEVVLYLGSSGVNVLTLRGHAGAVRAMASSADGSLLLSGSDDCSLRVWDLSEEKCIAILEGHSSPVRAVGFFRNVSMMVSGASDGSVRLWGLEWELFPWFGT
jgi:WD40 repeat protein/serine/threonine protein kinase